jgi:hypothetical protein
MNMRDKNFDILHINGKKYYAMGEFEATKVGYKFAEKLANNIRMKGLSARIIKRKTGYQVYSTSKMTVIPEEIKSLKKRKIREFVDKRGRHWFDDGFEIWMDDYAGDNEPFNDRDPRYIDDW